MINKNFRRLHSMLGVVRSCMLVSFGNPFTQHPSRSSEQSIITAPIVNTIIATIVSSWETAFSLTLTFTAAALPSDTALFSVPKALDRQTRALTHVRDADNTHETIRVRLGPVTVRGPWTKSSLSGGLSGPKVGRREYLEPRTCEVLVWRRLRGTRKSGSSVALCWGKGG